MICETLILFLPDPERMAIQRTTGFAFGGRKAKATIATALAASAMVLVLALAVHLSASGFDPCSGRYPGHRDHADPRDSRRAPARLLRGDAGPLHHNAGPLYVQPSADWNPAHPRRSDLAPDGRVQAVHMVVGTQPHEVN